MILPKGRRHPVTAPLPESLEKFTTHHHVAVLPRDETDLVDALAPFLQIGLGRREKCLLYCHPSAAERILSALREYGVDVGNALARGSILLTRPEAKAGRKPSFDPVTLVSHFRKTALQARAERYSALRIFLDVGFALGRERRRERIRDLQETMHSFLAEHSSLALCTYGTEEFPAEILLDVLRSHPFVIHQGRTLENFYFVHPAADPMVTTSAREFRERLELLVERHDQVARVRRQAVRLRKLQDVTLSLLGQAAVPDLLNGITEGVISLGYRMCWIGMARPDGSVEPVASWGDVHGYLDEVRVRWDGTPLADGPVGRAIRTGRPDVIRDVLRTRRFAPWRERARARGYFSAASVPLTEGGKPIGALAVYANARDAFDEEAVEELAAFALQASLVLQRAREFRKLSLSEERFRRLFERIPAACFTFDRTGIIRHWNMHCRSLYGYSPKEAVGKPIFALIVTPENRDRTADMIARVFVGDTFPNLEREDRCAGGGTRWLLSNVFPYRGPSERVELGISVNVDISGLVEAREALAESETRFRTVVEEINAIVVEIDREGRTRLFNRAAERLTGYKEEEVLGEEYFSLFLPERERDRVVATFREILGGKEVADYVNAVRTRDGSERLVSWTSKAVCNERGEPRGIVAIGADVTERRKMEEEKERLRHNLAQAQKMEAIGSLAGGIAHDYNNILGAIIGHTSRLQSRMAPDDPHRETVGKVQEYAERAAKLTTELIGFARGGKYHVEPLLLNDVVNDVVAIISRSFDKSIEIRTDLDPALRAVDGDRGQLRHSLLNLCLNARDAMKTGGTLSLNTRSAVLSAAEAKQYHVGRPGACAVLSITDTGEGMTEEVKQRLFEPFFTTKREEGQTGMGLPMVYGIVKNHNGGIHVESSPGRGTCFTVTLPASDRSERIRPALPQEPAAGGTGTILLVDDEPAIRDMGKEMLTALGYDVLLAEDGEAACRIFAEHGRGIALVLLDIVMPKMGGKETFASIRRMAPRIPVLLSSGYTVEGVAQEILDEGADGFIQKPYRMSDLARVLHSILDSVRSG